jgi:nitroimidazol reductase NimA-like FMN-containing flavoprotein (pyridoxamine 5'-phosphate oxidase superfamily)
MHETPEDLRQLQHLLDDSHARGGQHLRSIFTEERRVPAEELAARLTGVQVTHLATVTAKGEPRVAPVDGLFFRGKLWFGSSPESVRFRHIRSRPQVSASIAKGEEFAVLVHGRAHEVDTGDPAMAPFVTYCVEVYGDDWHRWAPGCPYAWIEAERMYTFQTKSDAP